MFIIKTKYEEQEFKNKNQAEIFYTNCAFATEGAESEGYVNILADMMATPESKHEVVCRDYVKTTCYLKYDPQEDYLKTIEK